MKGNRILLAFQIGLISAIGLPVLSYEPPVGIPVPSFGIEQSHMMYGDQLFDYDRDGTPEGAYRDAGNGPFTHYIDNSHARATDKRNPYGTPAKPRSTIPSVLSAGSVVEIHGAGYKWTVVSNERSGITGLNGTRQKPIFIRGYTNEKTKRPTMVGWGDNIWGGSYTIIENLDWDYTSMGSDNFEINQKSHHLGIRNCSFRDAPADYGRSVVAHWPSSGWKDNEWVEDILWYQCEWVNNGEFPSTFPSGIHGMQISQACRNIWVLECTFGRNSEDGIHIIRGGALYPKGRGNDYANHIYIGNSHFYEDGENAIDAKQSHDVIISGNTIWGYRDSEGSDGAAVVFNNDYPNDNLWLINNYIHDNTIGIRTQSKGKVYMVGNIFENNRHEPAIASPSARTGLGILASSFSSLHAVNNTFYQCDGGITVRNGGDCIIENNIFSFRLQSECYDLWLNRTPKTKYTLKSNLYWPQKRIKARSAQETGSVVGDPDFLSTKFGKIGLGTNSAALNTGVSSDAFQTFLDRYNLDLKEDLLGQARPVSSWDRGATEH